MSILTVPTRRSFLAGLALALATPSIVRAGSLMPVRVPIVLRPSVKRAGFCVGGPIGGQHIVALTSKIAVPVPLPLAPVSLGDDGVVLPHFPMFMLGQYHWNAGAKEWHWVR